MHGWKVNLERPKYYIYIEYFLLLNNNKVASFRILYYIRIHGPRVCAKNGERAAGSDI